jgi:hypothetical protein
MFSARSMMKAVFLVPFGVWCLAGVNPTIERAAPVQDESAPAPEHQRLMKLAGNYTTATKMSGIAGSESTGEATFTALLGGRFLLQEEKGTILGRPFEARKTYGFNTAAKKYEGTWTYTGSTAMMMLAGTSADSGKTIKFSASYEGPAGKTSAFEIVVAELGPDKFSIALTSKAEDGKATMLETVYTRKK